MSDDVENIPVTRGPHAMAQPIGRSITGSKTGANYARTQGGDMKIIRVITATAAGVILLSACGEKSDQARAQEYAIKACAIPTDDAGKPVRDSNGVVQFDASIGASLIYLDTDPISQLQAIHDDLAGLSANAQAASQLDSSWRSLADGIAMRTGVISVSLLARNRGENPFQTAVTSEDIAKYNQDLSEYKSECSGLATLLSE